MPYFFLLKSIIAGLIASFACGLGALPLFIKRIDPGLHKGIGYGIAGGLMFSASVYNLILPGLTLSSHVVNLHQVILVIGGIFIGSMFLWGTDQYFSQERLERKNWNRWGGRMEILIFITMLIHSIPEGIAVGVGYASEEIADTNLGNYIALAISIHNIPEGLAVAIPLRAAGASIHKCFWAAFLTSLPQPIAAVPAGIVSWLFNPIMPVLMGFAAGAMIFLIILELIPEALTTERPQRIAWAFIIGFSLMLLVQVIL